MLRPQFPFPTPEDCEDQDFLYIFNANDVPVLGNLITAGSQLLNIPLLLDPDAPFLWRGLAMENVNLMVRFKDPSGNYLSDGFVLFSLYGVPGGIAGVAQNGQPVVLEADAGNGQGAIFCPAGGIVQVDFYNNTAGSLTPGSIQLLGIKRYPKSLREACA
jgi:hypothetical protein